MENICNTKIIFKDNNFVRRNENSKKENKIYKYKYKNDGYLILKHNHLMIIIFLFIHNILKGYSKDNIIVGSSIITIKINQTGIQNIFNGENACWRDKFDPPDKVIINNIEKNDISAQYDLQQANNTIQLVWNDARENWGCLFKDCSNINEIDFSQFDFNQKIKGNSMFYGCRSLTSLNLNDFGKVKLLDAGAFFLGMSSLISLNLSNFDMSEVTDIGSMFYDCSLLTSLDLSSFQINSNPIAPWIFWGCSKLEYVNFKNAYFNPQNIFISARKNIVLCNHDYRIISAVENYECAIIDCSDNWRQNQKKINLANNQCVNDCSETDNNKYNYKNECYENCPDGTYNNNYMCEECHPDCKTCEKAADIISTNCNSCSDLDKYLNFGNCYKNDGNNNNVIINNNTNFDDIIENILSLYSPENKNELVIKRDNDEKIYHITNSKNELELLKNKSNNINNISIIDLGQCEKILRNEYNINDEDSLIIIKNEITSNKPTAKNLNYEVYDPYSKTKLNLSLCDDTPIDIYVPMELSKNTKELYEQVKESGYDMFNINDPFYQDICTPFDSSNGTDILLTDRINYIYNNDDTQCQSNCQFSYYSIESQYMQCSCSTNENKNNDNLIKDKFSSKKLYESFYDVLKYSNYNILKCHKIITNIDSIKVNIGFIISIIFFCCYLICLLIYIFQGINPLKKELKISLTNQKGKNNLLFKSKIFNLLFPPKKKNSSTKKISGSKRKNIKIIHKKNIYIKINKYANSGSNNINIKKSMKVKIKSLKSKDKNKYNNKAQETLKNDYELNELEYEKALKNDKRTLFQIYWAALKREHLIIFTFCSWNDYNLLSVKLSRFIFLIIGDMALNTFFFSDDSMHKLFLNYGKYNFIQQIPEITYSTIISSLIEIFLCFLSLTDKYFYHLKSSFIKGDKNNIRNIVKCIKIKLLLYYIFTFIFFIIYLYIISVFCGIYRNTQIAFIKDSLLSFSLCLVYPFFIYLLSSSLRYLALRNSKKKCKYLYNFSYIIPFF